MNKKFKSGISQTLIYYAAGFIIALLVYLLSGKNSRSFPGPHHTVLLLLITGGVICLFYYYALVLAKQNYKINYGSLTAHLISIISIIICMLLFTF